MKEGLAIGLGAMGVVALGAVAWAATRSSTGAAPAAGGGSSGGGTLPAGSPVGLLSSGPTDTGWAQHIAIQPNRSGLSYNAFFADRITISLPAGAHWRANTGAGNSPATGPQSGIDDFTFTLVEPITYSFSYTDVNGVNQGTTLSFALGGTFEATTRLSHSDYVILAIARADLVTVATALNAALSPTAGTPVLQQEAATVQIAQQTIAGGTATPALAIEWFVSMGPWADSFAPDVRALVVLPMGTALPSWWPSDDTAAAGEDHVIYRYIGGGIDVSALPIPSKAWKRVA